MTKPLKSTITIHTLYSWKIPIFSLGLNIINFMELLILWNLYKFNVLATTSAKFNAKSFKAYSKPLFFFKLRLFMIIKFGVNCC